MRTVVAMMLGAVALVGCGTDSDEPGDDGSPAASASSSSDEPTDAAPDGPEVEPATGEEIVTPHFSLRAPEGWRVRNVSDSIWDAEPRPLDGSSMTVGDLAVPGGAESLDSLARRALRNESAGVPESRTEILDPFEIDGVEVYHVGGRTNSVTWFDAYGPSVEGAIVNIAFRMPTYSVSRAEREALIESVLASVEWDL